MMKRFIILLTGLLLGLGAFAKERPNFLIIMADDCTICRCTAGRMPKRRTSTGWRRAG